MLGKGHGGVVTLYAAAMEQRVSRVASEGAITSYMEIVRAEHHANVIQSVVPGAVRDFDLPDLMAAILPRPGFGSWLHAQLLVSRCRWTKRSASTTFPLRRCLLGVHKPPLRKSTRTGLVNDSFTERPEGFGKAPH